MNKKQKDSKNVNKALSKKVAPFVMSTSMMAATLFVAGAPISAAELEEKGVDPEILEQVKNHGQEVSAYARSLPGSPEKGQLVSELAKTNSLNTDQLGTTNDDLEDNIDATTNDELQEGEASDDALEAEGEQAEEGTEAPAATPDAPVAEEGEASDDAAEVDGEEIVEEGTGVPAVTPDAPVAEEGEASDDAVEADGEEVVEEGTEAPAVTPTATPDVSSPVDETDEENVDEVDNSNSDTEAQNQDDNSLSSWVDETYPVVGD